MTGPPNGGVSPGSPRAGKAAGVPGGRASTGVEGPANTAATGWCAEVNGRVHSETSAVPDERLVTERTLLRRLPSLRPAIGLVHVRTVDHLRTVRFGSGIRQYVPTYLVNALMVVRPVIRRPISDRPGRLVRGVDVVGFGGSLTEPRAVPLFVRRCDVYA